MISGAGSGRQTAEARGSKVVCSKHVRYYLLGVEACGVGAKFETQNADHERDPSLDGCREGGGSETATLLCLI